MPNDRRHTHLLLRRGLDADITPGEAYSLAAENGIRHSHYVDQFREVVTDERDPSLSGEHFGNLFWCRTDRRWHVAFMSDCTAR